jgi:tetratricopeptide (TPR) repeat protein
MLVVDERRYSRDAVFRDRFHHPLSRRSMKLQGNVRRVRGVAAVAATLLGLACVAATQADEPQEKAAGTEERTRILIAQLGDGDYFVRERAQQELAQIGFEAFDALTAAEDDDDVEIAARAKYLVRMMRIDWIAESDPPEVKTLLSNYATSNEASRADKIKKLAALGDDKGLAVLCRIVRFEKTAHMSKLAAVVVLDQKLAAESWPARERTIREGIGTSTRPSAEWLKTYLASRADPAAAVGTWRALAEAEEKTLAETPPQTSHEVVAALWRQQAALLRTLDRRDEAVAAMMRIVALEQGETKTLSELLDWLIEQQAWNVIDEVAQRFSDQFTRDPFLMYVLAQARQAQGDEPRAEQLAAQALAMNDENQVAHYFVFVALHERHWLRWAERELRRTIAIGKPTDRYTIFCQSFLAEMLHDRGEDLAADELMEAAVASMQANIKADRGFDNGRLDMSKYQARQHYYRACHLVSPGEKAERVKQLVTAADHDPTDADVLIALYRLPDAEPALRERTMELIHSAADEFRRLIRENNDNDRGTNYNQLAWLIANTEGDFQEALRCSQRSLELRPNDPGLLDTLGRCYYAVGDLENAVKYQSKAVEINPHSGLMNKQLAQFREALAKKQAGK